MKVKAMNTDLRRTQKAKQRAARAPVERKFIFLLVNPGN